MIVHPNCKTGETSTINIYRHVKPDKTATWICWVEMVVGGFLFFTRCRKSVLFNQVCLRPETACHSLISTDRAENGNNPSCCSVQYSWLLGDERTDQFANWCSWGVLRFIQCCPHSHPQHPPPPGLFTHSSALLCRTTLPGAGPARSARGLTRPRTHTHARTRSTGGPFCERCTFALKTSEGADLTPVTHCARPVRLNFCALLQSPDIHTPPEGVALCHRHGLDIPYSFPASSRRHGRANLHPELAGS